MGSSPLCALVTSRGVLNRAWGRQGTQNNPLRFHRPKSALWLWNFLCCSDADSDGRFGFCGEIRSRAVLGVLLRVEQKPTFDADPYLQSAEVAGGGCAAARRTRRTAAAAWAMMRPFATGPHQSNPVGPRGNVGCRPRFWRLIARGKAASVPNQPVIDATCTRRRRAISAFMHMKTRFAPFDLQAAVLVAAGCAVACCNGQGKARGV